MLVKLGGSAITNKNEFESLKPAVLAHCAAQLKDAALLTGHHFVIIHGAGSFGHFQAKKYGLATGTNNPDWKFGFAETRRSVTLLNSHVMGALITEGLPAVCVSPFPTVVTTNRKLPDSKLLNTTIKCLDKGFMPVLHGDAVFDTELGCTIVSGDYLMKELAIALKGRLRAVIFVGDVPGVLKSPPGLCHGMSAQT